jgi:hypothetical protein
MRTQSFEYDLQHAIPPAPDPEARLKARRAALAEFERIHVPSKPVRSGLFSVLRFDRVALGGVATACVLVISVSLAWLMPEAERTFPLQVKFIEREKPPVIEPKMQAVEVFADPITPVVPELMSVPDQAGGPTFRAALATEVGAAGDSGAREEVSRTGAMPVRGDMPTSPVPVLTTGADDSMSKRSSEVPVTASRVFSKSSLLASSASVRPAPNIPQAESRDKFPHFEVNPVKRVGRRAGVDLLGRRRHGLLQLRPAPAQ